MPKPNSADRAPKWLLSLALSYFCGPAAITGQAAVIIGTRSTVDLLLARCSPFCYKGRALTALYRPRFPSWECAHTQAKSSSYRRLEVLPPPPNCVAASARSAWSRGARSAGSKVSAQLATRGSSSATIAPPSLSNMHHRSAKLRDQPSCDHFQILAAPRVDPAAD